ncbi:hypothetical protein [Edaphovirga cremea]|uniref:hypothetical protein n=1 Tax=Edaphovirga cremea TaxID=2267246 RepID=UPI000DEFBD84|nr:hypothetical protein [Edaphovirga cremea]
MKHPDVKPSDWIEVGGYDCVVMKTYNANSPFGICKVVFNKTKPTTRDVDWNGDKWFFPERPDFGGYGRNDDPYVIQLKKGCY